MAKNRDQILEQRAQWRAANREKLRLENAQYRAANKAKECARNAAWYLANKQKKHERNIKWWLDHPGQSRAYHVRWFAKNPEKVLARDARRRARKMDASVGLTETELANIRELYRQARMMSQLTGVQYHVDHVVAIARGGKHHPDNLQLLPAIENIKKGAR